MLDKVYKMFRKVRDNIIFIWFFYFFCMRYCNNNICFFILGVFEIIGYLESKIVINGSNVIFFCNVSGYFIVFWIKNGLFL